MVVPSCFESLSFDTSDTSGGRFVLFEQIERDFVDGGEVLSGVSCSFSAVVFAEGDTEQPVEFAFGSPLLPDNGVEDGGPGV
jgi:hypothetical protein